MAQNARGPITEHPLALGSFRSWLRLLWGSQGIDALYLPRALFVTLTTLFSSPLRLYEHARYGRVIRDTAIHPSPIFVVGHWRTGTTLLHHLMCQDSNLGFVSTFQALAPGFCLGGERWMKPLVDRMARRGHPTRIIDNIRLSMDAPEEDEFAAANTSRHSSLHLFSFPRQASTLFERYALHRGLSGDTLAAWTEAYLSVLQKATLRSGGRRLVLKNPANSGRIRTLLGLFPEAKFIHVVRNPYDVFLSTMATWKTVLPRSQLQGIGPGEMEACVLESYVELMQAFLRDRDLIPEGNLVEVRFEDLEKAPVEELRRVYGRLGLPGFAEAEAGFRAHLAEVAGYEKNEYALDTEVIGKVNRHWGFALGEWEYDVIETTDWQ